jgi:hypothetical protein
MVPDFHRREHALFRARDLATLIPDMLPAAAYDLDAGCNLGMVPNRGPAYNTVAANVDMGPHRGVPVGKERPKRNAAGQGTVHQCGQTLEYRIISSCVESRDVLGRERPRPSNDLSQR